MIASARAGCGPFIAFDALMDTSREGREVSSVEMEAEGMLGSASDLWKKTKVEVDGFGVEGMNPVVLEIKILNAAMKYFMVFVLFCFVRKL